MSAATGISAGEEIIRLAARGDGVTASGRHIPGAAPGDIVLDDGGLKRGSHYQDPPCGHYADCGGCQLQHVDDIALAEFVTQRIIYPLSGKGVEPRLIHPAILSPPASRRRATLRFWRKGRKLSLGFNSPASHRIINISHCTVLHPALVALLQPVRELLSHWPENNFSGSLMLSLVDQGVDLGFSGLEVEGLEQHEKLAQFARANALARLTLDNGLGPETQWEPEPLSVTFDTLPVSFPSGGFLQPTLDGERALAMAARAALQDQEKIADLFCGLGCFSGWLQQEGRKIYAADAARDSVLALKSATQSQSLPVFTEHRDLYRNPLRSEEISRFDAVLIDPPRAGAKEQITQIAASTLKRLCYISCNPSTFARDAQILQREGFQLDQIWPVGQFRWSSHVELASLFIRP